MIGIGKESTQRFPNGSALRISKYLLCAFVKFYYIILYVCSDNHIGRVIQYILQVIHCLFEFLIIALQLFTCFCLFDGNGCLGCKKFQNGNVSFCKSTWFIVVHIKDTYNLVFGSQRCGYQGSYSFGKNDSCVHSRFLRYIRHYNGLFLGEDSTGESARSYLPSCCFQREFWAETMYGCEFQFVFFFVIQSETPCRGVCYFQAASDDGLKHVLFVNCRGKHISNMIKRLLFGKTFLDFLFLLFSFFYQTPYKFGA